ncbi:hypothetical protein C9374_011396 [Naegleria lovaniensis]|uniref:Uncharacterized protein n=1 Tax=Naegleria lovaniensis TaxID=51637 RepID=A0AA88H290_NAELO|nr:uncharacterized protein C9374_011396 [Naegleria lovaniensis]KAG2392671.1 hypothetical protein C9374_011396 [Naegleria lovaniensis]
MSYRSSSQALHRSNRRNVQHKPLGKTAKHVMEMTSGNESDDGGRDVIRSMFALLKHRKQWLDRKFRTEPLNQLLNLIANMKDEDMKLDGPNESYYAFLFEQVCLKHLDELEFSVGTSETSSMFRKALDNNLLKFKTITVYVPKTVKGILKWLGIGLILSLIYSLIMYWKVSLRRSHYQSYKLVNGNSTPSLGNIQVSTKQYVSPMRGIVNLGL